MTSIFGGGTSSASEQSLANQQAANTVTQRFIEEQTGRAREDVLRLFPQGEEARRAGFQGALDVIGAGAPTQIQAFQQGNVGAQGVLGTGLNQFQRAILGQQQDLSGFAPQQISVDTSFLQNQQVPQIGPVGPPALPVDQTAGTNNFAQLQGGNLANILALLGNRRF